MTDPVLLLSQRHGEGRVTFRALRAAGFFSLAALRETALEDLAERAHLSLRTARRLKSGAEEMA
ncbi:MAG TPA: helix-hairpin-helix domain-containing protein, partial [Candidatus Polarisedimenticolia bacterium]|nr:helix-hairpin-helix domain-containing protein [Candidatus Polarisedimenticolia bacterium]